MQDTRTPYLQLSNLEEGIYTFTLKVTDSANQSSTAQVRKKMIRFILVDSELILNNLRVYASLILQCVLLKALEKIELQTKYFNSSELPCIITNIILMKKHGIWLNSMLKSAIC